MEDSIEDGIFICYGYLKECEITIKNQNLYFEEKCALENTNKWERKNNFTGNEIFKMIWYKTDNFNSST